MDSQRWIEPDAITKWKTGVWGGEILLQRLLWLFWLKLGEVYKKRHCSLLVLPVSWEKTDSTTQAQEPFFWSEVEAVTLEA